MHTTQKNQIMKVMETIKKTSKSWRKTTNKSYYVRHFRLILMAFSWDLTIIQKYSPTTMYDYKNIQERFAECCKCPDMF